jgi:tetratricopeptide (TPR) repeat protein
VPDTIQDVLLARVRRLEEAPRQILQVASVIGKEVPFVILRAIANLPEECLLQELTRLQAAEFLYEVKLFPELEYTFKHALTHDVAYGGVEPAWRRTLHARIVETIERLHHERLEEHVERLAHHAYRGELWDKAVTYARRAGLQALARSANREAVASFENALRAVRTLQASQDRRAVAVDLLLDLCTALRPLGEYERILECLREAEALAESMQNRGRLARIATDMTHFFWVTGQQDRAIDWGQRALALATALGDVTVEALANHRLGRVYHALADYRRAIDFSRRSFAVLGKGTSEARGGPATSGVRSRHWLVWSLAELGEFREGMAVAQEAVGAAEADGRPLTLIGAYLGSGYLYLVKGALRDAISALDRALSLCQTWQFPAWFPPVASALAFAYTQSGRVEEALPLAEAAVTRGASMRLLVGESYWMALLGEACARRGRVEDAARLLGSGAGALPGTPRARVRDVGAPHRR